MSSNNHLCLQCGKELTSEHAKKFCDRSCSAKYHNARRTPRTEESKQRSSTSKRIYDNSKPKFTKVIQCKVCGKWFSGKRKTCSSVCTSKIFSETATNNPLMGGNKNTRAYGWYLSPIAGRVYLESSYEYKVAMELDLHNISWSRPKYIPYNDKKYFPDFYLLDYDVYLDPKNDYLIGIDEVKIQKVREQNSVKVIVLNSKQLTWQAIQYVLDENSEIST